MSSHAQAPGLIEITETLVRLSVFLTQHLDRCLDEAGYSQLRSQLSVRESRGLGSQKPWMKYPDRARETEQQGGWMTRLFRSFLRQSEDTHG